LRRVGGHRPCAGVVIFTLSLAGCATHRVVASAGTELAAHSMASYRDEPDYELARVSGYANVKLMEALLRSDPENAELMLGLAQGFAGVAFAFAEEDLDRLRCSAPGAVANERRRLAALYRRGQAYAAAALEADHARAADVLAGSPFALRRYLAGFRGPDLSGLFWYAFNALGAAGAGDDEVETVFELGRVRVIAERLVELDAAYAHGGPLLLLGIIDASLPEHLSVVADRGASSFERARALNDGRFLLAHVEWARTYAVTTRDRDGFDAALADVLSAPPDILPEERLITTVAKRRARSLIGRSESLFSPPTTSDGEQQIPCS
jgi:hypothetical protein